MRCCPGCLPGFWQAPKIERSPQSSSRLEIPRPGPHWCGNLIYVFINSFVCPLLKCALSIYNVSAPAQGSANWTVNTAGLVSAVAGPAGERGDVLSALTGRIEDNGSSIPWEHRTEIRSRWRSTLDFKKVGEAGDGTPESPQGFVNPTGECFTDHGLCYQEDSGLRCTRHCNLKGLQRCSEPQWMSRDLGAGGRGCQISELWGWDQLAEGTAGLSLGEDTWAATLGLRNFFF